MLHDARMQNAVQTWQLIDLPLKYVRYRYPVQVICETWVHWLHSSRLSHTSCTPRRPSCAEVSRSYAELHHFSSRDENAIDIYQRQHMRTPQPSCYQRWSILLLSSSSCSWCTTSQALAIFLQRTDFLQPWIQTACTSCTGTTTWLCKLYLLPCACRQPAGWASAFPLTVRCRAPTWLLDG